MITKNKNSKKQAELIAPAGNIAKMKTALTFGADAVYAGIPDFSLRVRINDFDLAKIKEATDFCHKKKKKIYITINIFAHNRHLEKLPIYIKKLKSFGVDGLIASDPGVISIIKKEWPKAKIHLSTQANCTNWQAAKFWQKQGVKRIILGREVTLEEIKEIRKKCPGLELEYFVHGAMCMAYSGRCFLSKFYTGRSANLGDCVQPCRWSYNSRINSRIPLIKNESNELEFIINEKDRTEEILELVEEEHGSYILNSKDLCLIKYLDELKDAGITSFKIEGRAKSVYYQAMIAGIYSRATHNAKRLTKKINYLYKELNTKLVHRGYTTGFLLGDKGDQNLDDSHIKSDWEFCGQVETHCNASVQKSGIVETHCNASVQKSGIVETHCNASVQKKRICVKVHNTIRVGDRLEIVKPKYDIIKLKLKEMFDAKTGEKITEAHGGAGRVVIIETKEEIPKYSVVRRKI